MVLRSEILVNKNVLPTKEQALPGRDTHVQLPETHYVTGEPLLGPFSKNVDFAIFGLGCFWGAERKFWEREGVVSTVVGYAGGCLRTASDTGNQRERRGLVAARRARCPQGTAQQHRPSRTARTRHNAGPPACRRCGHHSPGCHC